MVLKIMRSGDEEGIGAGWPPISRPFSRSWLSQETRLPRRHQAPSEQVQVRQRKGSEQPRGVLRQAPVAHLAEAPQPLHHVKGMLSASSGAGADAIDPFLILGERLGMGAAPVDMRLTLAHWRWNSFQYA